MKTHLKKTVNILVFSISLVFLQLFLTEYSELSAKEAQNNKQVETETIIEKLPLVYSEYYDKWEITTTTTTTYNEDGSKIISIEAVSHGFSLDHDKFSFDKTTKTDYNEDGSRIALVETDEVYNVEILCTIKCKDAFNDDGSESHTKETISKNHEKDGNIERAYNETTKKIRKDGAIVTVTEEEKFLNDNPITTTTSTETAFDDETSKLIKSYTSFIDDISYKEVTTFTPDGYKSIRKDPDGNIIQKDTYKIETFEDRTRTTEITIFNNGLTYIHKEAEYTDGSFSEITKKVNPSIGMYSSEFERTTSKGIIYSKDLNIEGGSGTYEHTIENENTGKIKTIKLLLKEGYAVLDSFDYSNEKNIKLPSSKVLHGKKYKIKEVSGNCFQSDDADTLKSLELGKYVTKISVYAFTNLTSLKEITIKSKIRSVGSEIFPNNVKKLTIKLPINNQSAYNTEVKRLKSVFKSCICPELTFVQVTD